MVSHAEKIRKQTETRERYHYPERFHDGGKGAKKTEGEMEAERKSKRRGRREGVKAEAPVSKASSKAAHTAQSSKDTKATKGAKAVKSEANEVPAPKRPTATSKTAKDKPTTRATSTSPPPPSPAPAPSRKKTELQPKHPPPSSSSSRYLQTGDPISDDATEYLRLLRDVAEDMRLKDEEVFAAALEVLEEVDRRLCRILDWRIEVGGRRLGIGGEGGEREVGQGKGRKREGFGGGDEGTKKRKSSSGADDDGGEELGKKKGKRGSSGARKSRTPSGAEEGSAGVRRSPRKHSGSS